MNADCYKCRVPLVRGETTRTKREHTHTIYRCPSCHKVRAVRGEIP